MSPFEQNLQRTLNAVAMKPLDKIPCSFNGPAYMAKRQGLTLSEYLRDPRKAANAAIAFCKAHPGVDSIHSPAMNVHTLPVLWLSEIAVPGVDLPEDKLWQVHEKEKMPFEDYQKIIDGGYTRWVLKYLHDEVGNPVPKLLAHKVKSLRVDKPLQKEAGIPVMNCASIGSPIEGFCGARQMMNFFIDMMEEPELVRKAMDQAMPFLEAIFVAQMIEPWEIQKSTDPDNIIRAMDKYGVDVACILPESMMDTTGYSSRWCTNQDAWKAVQKYPDRFIINPNLSTIKKRGVDNAIWEMEYWVEKGAKIFKYYSPEDTYLNDPELWPFYKRAEELGIVLCLHAGFSWVPPGKSKYCYPTQIDDIARDFLNLKIVAFHMGYPFTDAMNMVALGHPNVYLCLSLLVPWALTAPYKFAHILGEAMRFVGPDRIIWGTDSAGYWFHCWRQGECCSQDKDGCTEYRIKVNLSITAPIIQFWSTMAAG